MRTPRTRYRRSTDPPFSPGVSYIPEDFARQLTRLKEVTGLSGEGLATVPGVKAKQVHRWRQGGEPCSGAVLALVRGRPWCPRALESYWMRKG